MSEELPDLSEALEIARESAVGQDWSNAVRFSRNAEFILEESSAQSISIRVLEPNKTLSTRVEIDIDAADWQSDCHCDEDPCQHVLAALIAAKNKVNFREKESESSAKLVYSISIEEDELCVKRFIEYQDARRPFRGTLRDYIGGLQSGRISGARIIPSKEDFAVEQSIGKDGVCSREQAEHLLRTLRTLSNVEFLNEAAILSDSLNSAELRVEDHHSGYRVRRLVREDERRLKNGFVIAASREISVAREFELDSSYLKNFSPNGQSYSKEQAIALSSEIIPLLSRYADIDHDASFPQIIQEEPYAIFQLNKLDGLLSVTPRILYGHPPVLEVAPEGVTELAKDVIVHRAVDAEKLLFRRLQTELHLQPGRTVTRQGAEAVAFAATLKEWETQGEGVKEFEHAGQLHAHAAASEDGLELSFSLEPSVGAGKKSSVTTEQVLRAWEQGESLIPLQDGGWAEIPQDWFERYGEQIRELLALEKDDKGKVHKKFHPLLAEVVEEIGGEVSATLSSLRRRLADGLSKLEDTSLELPSDLTATLRSYQTQGVRWLQEVRQLGAGAILADDMGLGKTLQIICILQGRTLVVAPTSVLDSWCEQLSVFRPNLNVSRYHGAKREFSENADVVVTSYAILRREAETFSEQWDTIVVDEGQNIKNPESATTKAIVALSGEFRVSLSGTPVENKAEDLWSQFHFVFPELLGSKRSFETRFARGLRRGDESSAAMLQRRIAPFILRRKKTDVLKELPAKTEVILNCELNEEERSIYQSLYLSSKESVRKALDGSGKMLAALEALLRLRQVCAHTALLPKESATEGSASESSKCKLLLESLKNSKEAGHRSLVFSQWTSMLDIIEGKLEESELSYLRLDGSTKDRKSVIDSFQEKDGADLLLLSLKAGGVGITLTAADHIYLYDSWWNPAVEDQAADRAHRIGQQNPVLVHRLIAKDTVEENVLALQEKKREMADNILSGAGAGAGLNKEDLEILFSELA